MAVRRKRSILWIVLASVPVLAGVAFFSLRALSRTPAKIDAEKLARVERIDLARSVVATGKIEPTTKVEIKSKASGIIQKLPVNVGDTVRQGQVICELDQNDLLPRLRQAQAALGVAAGHPPERPGGLRAQQSGGRRTGRSLPQEGHGPRTDHVPGAADSADRARRRRKELPARREPPAAGHRQPGSGAARPSPRPKPRWSR